MKFIDFGSESDFLISEKSFRKTKPLKDGVPPWVDFAP